jgi:hypothetical protein
VLFSDNGGILLLKREGQRVPAEKTSEMGLDELMR